MGTESINGAADYTMVVAKTAAGEDPQDKGAPTDKTGAIISTYNQDGLTQSNDETSTIATGQILPQEYRFDQEQVTANMAAAISSDVQDMTEAELIDDETFAAASMRVDKALYGREFGGTNQEAAQQGIELMRKVDNILLNPSKESMLGFANSVQYMKPDEAIAALYMMDMFEAKNATLAGTADAIGYMGLDAANYVGIATLGWAFAGKQAAKATAKVGMRAALEKIAYSTTAAGAIEGGGYTAAFEHGKQQVSEAGGQGYDTGSVGLNAAIGAGIGAAAGKYLPELFDYAGEKIAKWAEAKNFKAEVQMAADAGDIEAQMVLDDLELLDNHFDDDGAIREQLAKSAKVEEQMAVQAGGGTPPSKNVDETIAAAVDMTPKQKQKHFGAAMRDASPEDKKKYIAAMKADAPAPKPKTLKQQAKIDEQLEFNDQFYSKLEHEMNKMPDDMRFENSKDYIDHLKKNGVKQDEIDASGIQDTLDGYGSAYVTGGGVKQAFLVTPRGDLISKRTYTPDDFGGSDGSLSREDWEAEWTTRYDIEEVSVGEQGYGIKIEDDNTGQIAEIGYSYNDDVYVNENETEFTFDEMLDEYMAYDAYDEIAAARDELADELEIDVADVIEDDAIARAREAVLYEDTFRDNYYQKTVYETGDGRTFYDLDDAVENTYDNLYSDYESMVADREGNSFEDYTVSGGDDYKMEVYQMEDFTSEKTLHEEPHLGEDYSNEMEFGAENVQVHARIKTRTDDDGNTGDVLEEIQSQWEQDWRKEGGGTTAPTDEEVTAAQTKLEDLQAEAKPLKLERQKLRDEERMMIDKNSELHGMLFGRSQLSDGVERDAVQIRFDAARKEIDANTKSQEVLSDKITVLNDAAGKVTKVARYKEPSIATPPIQKRTQYEKVVLLDNVINSIKDGKDYFGWINGHIQNGSSTPDSQIVGMTQAYDKEMPRIIQKATGETPYMQGFDGAPVLDDDSKKIYWNKDKVEDINYYNAQNAGQDWHWRIDLTDALKAKLKDAKIQMYGVGGAALVGANGQLLEGDDNAN